MPVPKSYGNLPQLARPLAPLAVVVLAVVAGQFRGLGLGLLVLAGGMLLAAISLFWSSVQSLGDEGGLSLDEALALGAPSAEEERKRSVLRALKDLEYERSVGKISDEDYDKLSARYRDEARRLLRQLENDESPARERAEKLVARHLARIGLESKKSTAKQEKEDETETDESEDGSQAPTSEPTALAGNAPREDEDGDRDEDEDEDEDGDDESAEAASARTCEECDTANDADARFCKSCGEPLT